MTPSRYVIELTDVFSHDLTGESVLIAHSPAEFQESDMPYQLVVEDWSGSITGLFMKESELAALRDAITNLLGGE